MNILMPQLGETVSEGTIVIWYKRAGDEVKFDEVLIDVETDKVSTEIPSPADGIIAEILVAEGETVEVGAVLATIEPSGVEEGTEESRSAAANADVAQTPLPTPESLSTQRPLQTPQPSQPTQTQRPPQPSQPSQTLPASPPSTSARSTQGLERGGTTFAPLSPAVRRLLAEHEIDPSKITGTGRNGRIKRTDVLEFLELNTTPAVGGSTPPGPANKASARVHGTTDDDSYIPFNRIRRVTAEHMVRSKATSPHVLQAVEVDFHRVARVRRRHAAKWKDDNDFSLTFLPFVARAVCIALREYPHVNGSIEGEGLRVHREVRLAIAVDLDHEGLVAPVIASADGYSVAGLARQINLLARKARDGNLSPDDLTGGTYTISNSGSFGTLITAPIINQPQVAILSTDGVKKRPVVISGSGGDSIAIRPVGILAQSFDHRAIDGACSAAFLRRLQSIIEETDWESEL